MNSSEPDPTDPAWSDGALSAIREMARRGTQFQAADVAKEFDLANPPHPGTWSRLFARAHADGLIRRVGAAQSHRRSVNKSLVTLWVGVDDGLPDPPGPPGRLDLADLDDSTEDN